MSSYEAFVNGMAYVSSPANVGPYGVDAFFNSITTINIDLIKRLILQMFFPGIDVLFFLYHTELSTLITGQTDKTRLLQFLQAVSLVPCEIWLETLRLLRIEYTSHLIVKSCEHGIIARV